MMAFESYRKRVSNFEIPKTVKTEVLQKNSSLNLSLKISLKELNSILLVAKDLKGNFTAILGQNPRNYFSLSEINSTEPDFHLAESFKIM